MTPTGRARPLVIAHRTCPPHAPENSLLGIERAAALGADVVEVDVRLTLEGRPVLLHDRTLRRTTGLPGPPYLHREATVLAREIGAGERVPSFGEALAALPAGLRMAVDVKVRRAVHPVLTEVVRHGAEDRVLVWSRHPSVVRFTADRHPTIEASLLRDTRSERRHRAFLAAAARSRARGISALWESVTPAFVAEARARGLRVYAWCRTREIDPARLALLDGVVTDWPEAARAALDAA